MSTKELGRLEVLLKLKNRELRQSQAADILDISVRQVRRLLKAYRCSGAQAIVSKQRGQPSNRQLPPGVKELALHLIRSDYPDFGPTLAREKLVEKHELSLSVSSVRRLMLQEELWQGKTRKQKRVFQLRDRRSKEGELEQVDGSPHAWFEERGPKCSLLHYVDDASGKIKAGIFAPSETIWSYFDLFKIYLRKHGKPRAIYSDKHAVFRVNKSGALTGEGVTQCGRAMKQLGIHMIFAHSPQAKGRIERSNRTLQDRLVKELRLHNISTIEEANAFLPTFIEEYNRRFSVLPKDPTNAHRPVHQDDFDSIFTVQEHRVLSKNLIFQYKGDFCQICTERETYALRGARVTVREHQDGIVDVLYKNQQLLYRVYGQQEKQHEVADSKILNKLVDNLIANNSCETRVRKPPLNHPWRRRPKLSLTC